jgi:hypothetical protein
MTSTHEDVEEFLESLVLEIYGRRPEWLDYDLGDSYKFRGREFVRMICPAGSVHAHLSLRALTGEGIGRDILELGTRHGRELVSLLHNGQQSEYEPEEIQRVC